MTLLTRERKKIHYRPSTRTNRLQTIAKSVIHQQTTVEMAVQAMDQCWEQRFPQQARAGGSMLQSQIYLCSFWGCIYACALDVRLQMRNVHTRKVIHPRNRGDIFSYVSKILYIHR